MVRVTGSVTWGSSRTDRYFRYITALECSSLCSPLSDCLVVLFLLQRLSEISLYQRQCKLQVAASVTVTMPLCTQQEVQCAEFTA